jgi:hypothetical protein
MKTLIASLTLRALVLGSCVAAIPAHAQKPPRAHKVTWDSLSCDAQKQLKLFWGLNAMIAEERFNNAPAAAQVAALKDAARQSAFDLKDRAVADLPRSW